VELMLRVYKFISQRHHVYFNLYLNTLFYGFLWDYMGISPHTLYIRFSNLIHSPITPYAYVILERANPYTGSRMPLFIHLYITIHDHPFSCIFSVSIWHYSIYCDLTYYIVYDINRSMMKFNTMITEDKGGKNLHLEHLEDEIINFGVDGGRAALNFLRSLRDMLAGSSRSSVNMTVKWDGAPAIFAGIDPDDGKFFVAKKSVFNVNPKLYKSIKEIDDDLSGALNSKFKVALTEFSKLGIKGVLQGDLMWTDDTENKTIDGIKYITFQPNTIVYAVPVDSDLGNYIKKSKIGIVWHTTYTGSTLQGMKASFGANISSLKKPSSIWMDDATYKDTSGSSTFTTGETEKITAILSSTGKTFQKINAVKLRSFLALQNSMTGAVAGASLKTYNNSKVRAGQIITNPAKHAKGYEEWVMTSIQKQIDKAKSEGGKKKYTNIQKEFMREVKKHTINLVQVITFQNLLVEGKMMIVKKLNSVKGMGTFVRTADGFKVTNPEGYVAIDRISGDAVKLVDRMEFSYNNFTAIKSWDK